MKLLRMSERLTLAASMLNTAMMAASKNFDVYGAPEERTIEGATEIVEEVRRALERRCNRRADRRYERAKAAQTAAPKRSERKAKAAA